MAILEHKTHTTPYRLYANRAPQGPLSNQGSGIPGIMPSSFPLTIFYISTHLFTNTRNNDDNENYMIINENMIIIIINTYLCIDQLIVNYLIITTLQSGLLHSFPRRNLVVSMLAYKT